MKSGGASTWSSQGCHHCAFSRGSSQQLLPFRVLQQVLQELLS